MPFGPFLSPPGKRLEASSQAFLPDLRGWEWGGARKKRSPGTLGS